MIFKILLAQTILGSLSLWSSSDHELWGGCPRIWGAQTWPGVLPSWHHTPPAVGQGSLTGAQQDGGQDWLNSSALRGMHLAQEAMYFSCLFFFLICYFQVPKKLQDTEHRYAHHNLNTAGNFNISAACTKPSNTCIFYLIYCNTFLPSLESNFSLKRNCLIGKCTKYNYTAYKLQYCLWEYHCRCILLYFVFNLY